MDIASLARPKHIAPVAPQDEIRFRYMENPFEEKFCRGKQNPSYCEFLGSNWHYPPPLPVIGDEQAPILGIPAMWYWLAIGCKDCVSEPNSAALPVVVAIWADAFKNNRRQIRITKSFLQEWSLASRSADRILKRLHEKALLVHVIHNSKHNSVILLPSPFLEE